MTNPISSRPWIFLTQRSPTQSRIRWVLFSFICIRKSRVIITLGITRNINAFLVKPRAEFFICYLPFPLSIHNEPNNFDNLFPSFPVQAFFPLPPQIIFLLFLSETTILAIEIVHLFITNEGWGLYPPDPFNPWGRTLHLFSPHSWSSYRAYLAPTGIA